MVDKELTFTTELRADFERMMGYQEVTNTGSATSGWPAIYEREAESDIVSGDLMPSNRLVFPFVHVEQRISYAQFGMIHALFADDES